MDRGVWPLHWGHPLCLYDISGVPSGTLRTLPGRAVASLWGAQCVHGSVQRGLPGPRWTLRPHVRAYSRLPVCSPVPMLVTARCGTAMRHDAAGRCVLTPFTVRPATLLVEAFPEFRQPPEGR